MAQYIQRTVRGLGGGLRRISPTTLLCETGRARRYRRRSGRRISTTSPALSVIDRRHCPTRIVLYMWWSGRQLSKLQCEQVSLLEAKGTYTSWLRHDRTISPAPTTPM